MITTLVIQLEAWLQEEIAAQGRIARALEALERAVRAGQAAGITRAGGELEAELAGAPAREARRRTLLARLAAALSLPPGATTLTRIAARLAHGGHDLARLEPLRSELRTTVAGVTRASRRLAAVARYHEGLLEELCAAFAAGTEGSREARLVDTRG